MSRPTQLQKGSVLRWVLPLFDSDSCLLVDADEVAGEPGLPAIVVRKNGTPITATVSVVKRESSTGLYDCAYDPDDEVSGDSFTIEERATIGEQEFFNSWECSVVGNIDAPRQLTLQVS